MIDLAKGRNKSIDKNCLSLIELKLRKVRELEGLPKILYKYISWDNIFHKRILSENEIYFSSFDEFNDPFEGELPFRYRDEDLTDENIIQYTYNRLLQAGKIKVSEQVAKQHIRDRLLENPLKKEYYWRKLKTVDNFNRIFGIFCLTDTKENHLMWSHYSNSHKGLCIGFSTDILYEQFNATIRKVIYSDIFPRMPLFGDFVNDFLPFLYTKSKLWEYENEYRFFETRMARKSVNISNEAFKEILFGCKMPESTKREISIFALEKYPGIKLFETAIDDEKFQLNIIPYSLTK